ncbi:MAG: TolC family protein [Deltaproteobacteria bacterium]|nr:TolC family protein [Deltaproteobacteria bacterium]
MIRKNLLGPLLVVVALLLATRPAHTQDTPAKTLAECIEIGLANHPSLKAASASVEAGNERVWEAASGYLPSLTAIYRADRQHTNLATSTGTVGTGGTSRTFNFYRGIVSFSQVLFDFGQTLDSIRAAQASRDALEADRNTQKASVIFGVKQAYFTLITAHHLLSVADETVRQNQQHLELAEGRHEVGLAPKIDVTTAKVQLSTSQLNQLTASNSLAIGRETLRNALGLDGPLTFDVVDLGEIRPNAPAANDAVQRAYDNRPELRSLQLQGQALEEQVSSLQKHYLPTINGNGQYQWAGSQYPLQDTWDLYATVNLTQFNFASVRAQIAEAKANLANLRYNEDVERQSIALEVRQAVLNVQQAVQSIDVARQGRDKARENLEIAEGRYQTGVGSIIELTDAQASRTTAEANYVQAQYSYETSLAALEKATGTDLSATNPNDISTRNLHE